MDHSLASTASYPGKPEVRRRLDRGTSPAEIRDRIPGFHTDFTQNGRSEPHTLRHISQSTARSNATTGRSKSSAANRTWDLKEKMVATRLCGNTAMLVL